MPTTTWFFSKRSNFYKPIKEGNDICHYGELVSTELNIWFRHSQLHGFKFALKNRDMGIVSLFTDSKIQTFLEKLAAENISYHYEEGINKFSALNAIVTGNRELAELAQNPPHTPVIEVHEQKKAAIILALMNEHFKLDSKYVELQYLLGFKEKSVLENYSNLILELINQGLSELAIEKMSLHKHAVVIKNAVTHCVLQRKYKIALNILKLVPEDNEAISQVSYIKNTINNEDLYFWDKFTTKNQHRIFDYENLIHAFETKNEIDKYFNQYCGFQNIKIKNIASNRNTLIALLKSLVALNAENDLACERYYALKNKIKIDTPQFNSESEYNKNLIQRLQSKRTELTLSADNDYESVPLTNSALPKDIYSEFYINIKPKLETKNENLQQLEQCFDFDIDYHLKNVIQDLNSYNIENEEPAIPEIHLDRQGLLSLAEHLFTANQKKQAIMKATYEMAKEGQELRLKVHTQKQTIKQLEQDILNLEKAMIKAPTHTLKSCLVM